MKLPFLKFLLFGFIVTLFACGDGPTKGVEDLFDNYKVAIEQEQYEKAATFIDQKSVEYYNQVIKLALETERKNCLLYTSPSPRDATLSRMPSSA